MTVKWQEKWDYDCRNWCIGLEDPKCPCAPLMCNGNKPKTPFFDVVAQNLPGTCSIDTLSMHMEQILCRCRPVCLVVTEASCLKLQHVQFAGYNWIPGTIAGSSNCRVSMYVQDCLSYDVIDNLTCKVPTIGIINQSCYWGTVCKGVFNCTCIRSIQYASFTLQQWFLPFFYVKSWSNLTPNGSFKICSLWRF